MASANSSSTSAPSPPRSSNRFGVLDPLDPKQPLRPLPGQTPSTDKAPPPKAPRNRYYDLDTDMSDYASKLEDLPLPKHTDVDMSEADDNKIGKRRIQAAPKLH
ncbi:uncharacterized protein EKO05_0006736 [Ascochyta rabiei]|uniref:Uncharacterized protein n=1 Tax=Didymella rabiei TaxID=5454 RepID=A0A163LLC0_DIDRA|nr:uncharacterized protein EKO05_0006736 [Ascochyta rabiei]KZM27892.1 hypothetical protein ST47_g965 [Ascochyta rabiei]UPX16328.1 hypothetical protein EKO05_0006736 [Ascochyta rabiei]